MVSAASGWARARARAPCSWSRSMPNGWASRRSGRRSTSCCSTITSRPIRIRMTASFSPPAISNLTDPFVTLSYVAGRTSRIRLATGICLVPERNPLVLAKAVASLDFMSGGRAALGRRDRLVGGGIRGARDSVRTPRAAHLRVCRRDAQIVEREQTSFSGEFVNFKEARSFPKPAQPRRSADYLWRRERPRATPGRALRQRLVQREADAGAIGGKARAVARPAQGKRPQSRADRT